MQCNRGDSLPVILVVDDNPVNLQIIGAILTDQVECELVFVADGEAALRAVQEWHPVLVLLDIMMPGMDGYEVCERLKADPQTAELPVIYITAKTAEEDVLKGFATGAVDYITKPFRADELLARVRTHLRLTLAQREVRRQAEEIKQSEIWFKALYQEAPVSIMVHDKDTGEIIDANPYACASYGVESIAELQQLPLWADAEYTAADAKTWIRKTVQEGPQCFEWRSRNRAGDIFWERVCLQMIRLREVERVLAIGVPITDQKALEAERQLMQVKLMQTGRLEAVGQLAAGIAHEINNPVQFIGDNTTFVRDAMPDLLGLAGHVGQVVEHPALDAEVAASLREQLGKLDLGFLLEEIPLALEQTLDGVQRVKRIVQAMREFAHPDSEERVLVDVNACVRNSATITRSVWDPVAELTMQLSDPLPSVHGYMGAMNQVLTNLIINAAQAMEGAATQSPGEIVIRTVAREDAIEISVKDTGGGIPPEIQSRVFDPFFTTKPVGKGTGQGLSLARNIIVKDHGGEIEFESAPGQGTTFIIRLPVAGAASDSGDT